jgi:hypothetical protein
MLFRIFVPQIINPVDDDYITRLAAFQQKGKIGIFGNARTHIASGDGFAIMGNGQYLYVMGGNQFISGFIFIATMFHWVRDQSANLGVTIQPFGTYFYTRHINPHSRQ